MSRNFGVRDKREFIPADEVSPYPERDPHLIVEGGRHPLLVLFIPEAKEARTVPLGADIVARVVLQKVSKIPRAAGAVFV